MLSAFVGVSVAKILPSASTQWIANALSVSIAITVMQLTRTLHPPGGASALIATAPALRTLSWFYIVAPVLLGAVVMVTVALLVNNVTRQYPVYWWTPHPPPDEQQPPQDEADDCEEQVQGIAMSRISVTVV